MGIPPIPRPIGPAPEGLGIPETGTCPTCGHSDFPKSKTLKPGKSDQTPEAVPDLNAAIDKVEERLGGKRPGHWYTVFDVMNYLAYVATDEEIAGMVS